MSLYYFINEYIYPISKSELKAIELIDNAILYLNMGMFSESATALDQSYKLNAPILDLNYFVNINLKDTISLNNLYNTFIDIEQFDSTITTSNFFLGILDLKYLLFSNNKNSNLILRNKIKEFNPEFVYIHNTWFKASLGIFKILSKKKIKTIIKLHNFR